MKRVPATRFRRWLSPMGAEPGPAWRPLRRLPPLAAISSAASLIVVAEQSDLRTAMTALVAVSAAIFILSCVYTRKAWALRVASSLSAAAAIGVGVGAESVSYLAVAGAVLPLIGLTLLLGPPGSVSASGPKWDPGRAPRRGGTSPVSDPDAFHVPTRVLGSIDAYLLLAEAVTFQFVAGAVDTVAGTGAGTDTDTGTGAGTGTGTGTGAGTDTDTGTGIFIVSFLMSVLAVVLIGFVAAGRGVDVVRRGIRTAGLVAQVYILAVGSRDTAVRVVAAVVTAVFALPATL
jgi:hypothetical protein